MREHRGRFGAIVKKGFIFVACFLVGSTLTEWRQLNGKKRFEIQRQMSVFGST